MAMYIVIMVVNNLCFSFILSVGDGNQLGLGNIGVNTIDLQNAGVW